MAEDAKKKHERYKKFYEANKENLNKYRRGEITKEEYFALRKLSNRAAKKMVNCIDCGNEVSSKSGRCNSCQSKFTMIEHLKKNPIQVNPGQCSILIDLYEGKGVGY